MNKVIFIFIFLINSVICGSQTRITIDTAYLSTSIDSAIGYPRGSNKQIVYNAPDVYKLDSLYINNEYNQQFTRDSLKSFTFNNIQNPQTLNLVFQKQTYNLHFIYHNIFTTDSIVQIGDTVRFIWTVNEAYFIDSLFVDSVKSDSINSLTFNNINRNHTIRIVLKLKTFTINASTSVGGTISNAGIISVDYGARPTYTIIPSKGYLIDSIFVNGVKINTSLFSYQFDSIKSNQTIRVVYKQAQKPSKPKNVQILVGKNNIVLKYSTPDIIGANYIIKYTARVLNTNIVDSTTDNYINIAGLEGGRDYTISLTATNDGYIESDTILLQNIQLRNAYIIITQVVNGNISNTVSLDSGSTVRITYTANVGYTIDSIIVNGMLNNDSIIGYTFRNINSNQEIRVVYKLKTFTINASTSVGGTISNAGIITVDYGARPTYTIIPSKGYLIDSIFVNGVKINTSLFSYQFDSIKSNQTIRVVYKQAQKPSKPKNVQILVGKNNIVLKYSTPDTIGANYIIKYTARVLNTNIADSSTDNYINIAGLEGGRDYTISLTATNDGYIESDTILLQNIQLRNAYNIITQVVNGNISNAVSLDSGNTVRITFTANVGYTIDSVIVNGMLNNDSIIGYTFRNINSNQQIRVVYKLKTFTITSSAGIGGSISPQGITNINYGLNQTYIISPNAGNGLDSLFIDDVLNKDSITSYTFKNITANHKIRATFKTLCGLLTEAPVIIRTNNTLNSSIDYVNYIWKLDAALIANSNNKSISPTTTGIYTLQGINNAGCSSAVSKKYYYSQTCITPTGRLGNAAFIQGNIINNNNQIFVKWCPDLITQNITIKVLNTQGSIIYEQIIPPNNGIFILNKNLLQDKTFFIQVFSADGALLQTSDLIINQ